MIDGCAYVYVPHRIQEQDGEDSQEAYEDVEADDRKLSQTRLSKQLFEAIDHGNGRSAVQKDDEGHGT